MGADPKGKKEIEVRFCACGFVFFKGGNNHVCTMREKKRIGKENQQQT